MENGVEDGSGASRSRCASTPCLPPEKTLADGRLCRICVASRSGSRCTASVCRRDRTRLLRGRQLTWHHDTVLGTRLSFRSGSERSRSTRCVVGPDMTAIGFIKVRSFG